MIAPFNQPVKLCPGVELLAKKNEFELKNS